MRKIRPILTKLLLAAMVTTALSPAYVYAGEFDLAENTARASDETVLLEENEVVDMTSDEMENAEIDRSAEDEFSNDLLKNTSPADTRQITEIDPPKKTEYSFEYKYSLPRLLKNLPSRLTIRYENVSETIDISWKCEDDYSKDLDRYIFVPDLDGYRLAEDIEVPKLTVRFEGDRPVYPGGALRDEAETAIRIPISENDHASAASIPKYYNVYEKGKLPTVRNQDPYGTCWAFATIACMEADLIHDGTAKKSIDLSELHTAYYAGNFTDPKNLRKDSVINYGAESWLDNGGWIVTGENLLTNLTGAVKEGVAPYGEALTISSKLKDKSYAVSKDSYRLDRAYYYNTEDRNGIKKAIMDHGAVMAGFSVNNTYDYYNDRYNSYYNPEKQDGGGHFINLVGWDDNFSADKFNDKPKGDGAWLVRNSWGVDDYDLFGYFWISYYDWGLINWSHCMMAFDAVKSSYKNCYSYDGFVPWDAFYFADSPATQKTTYTVSGGEAVKAVGIDVITDGNISTGKVTAKVTVKNKKTGRTSTGKITCPRSGFYTVKLDDALAVPQKANVEVTVKYTSPSGKVVICMEDKWNGQAGFKNLYYNTVCDKGFTVNGKKVKIGDAPADPSLKLYTVKNVKVTKVSLNKSKKTVKKGKTFTLKATVKPSNATIKKVKWTTSDKKIATVTKDGKVKGIKKGTATITATATDGSKKKAKCKVTVVKK